MDISNTMTRMVPIIIIIIKYFFQNPYWYGALKTKQRVPAQHWLRHISCRVHGLWLVLLNFN